MLFSERVCTKWWYSNSGMEKCMGAEAIENYNNQEQVNVEAGVCPVCQKQRPARYVLGPCPVCVTQAILTNTPCVGIDGGILQLFHIMWS
jgi:hypothetical protein